MDLYVDVSQPIPEALGVLGATRNDVKTPPLLQSLLQRHTPRIKSLAVRTTTQTQAHSFLASIYSASVSASHMPSPLALRRLTINLTANSPPVAPSLHTPISRTLPLLPCLTSLKLTNYDLPIVPAANLRNLRTLTIIRRLRAQPLSLWAIFRVMRSAPLLVRLELEARIDSSPPKPSSEAEPKVEGNEGESHLITLSKLTHLSLRTNNLHRLLERLYVPDLHTLHLDDLHGNRLGGAEEEAHVLRQLLVRMELPNEERRGNGLEVLEMVNVPIKRKQGEQDGLWEWCFRRMWMLRRIHASGVDTHELLELLMEGGTRRDADPARLGDGAENEDMVCPRLQCVSLAEVEPLPTIERFKLARPGVSVRLGVVDSMEGNEDMPCPLSVSLHEPTRPATPIFGGVPGVGGVGGFGFGSRFSSARQGRRKAQSSDEKESPRMKGYEERDGW